MWGWFGERTKGVNITLARLLEAGPAFCVGIQLVCFPAKPRKWLLSLIYLKARTDVYGFLGDSPIIFILGKGADPGVLFSPVPGVIAAMQILDAAFVEMGINFRSRYAGVSKHFLQNA